MAFDRRMRFAGLVLTVFLLPLAISSRRYRVHKDDESLKVGDRIHIFANLVRPSGDTCERYAYFEFPFCPPGERITNRTRSFDDLLNGDCYTNTQYELRFKTSTARKTLCEKSLTKSEVEKLRNAIKRNFVYQLAYQNGSLLGEVGRIKEDEKEGQKPKYYLATHTSFYIRHYRDQVIDVSIMRDPESDIDITEASKLKVHFTYSVSWEEIRIPADQLKRLPVTQWLRGYDESWTSLSVEWASTTLIWLTVIAVAILAYFFGYLSCCWGKKDSDLEFSLMLRHNHSEICNCPQYTSLLGAILGNGTQLLIMVCAFFVLARNGLLRTCDVESLCSYISRLYCITCVVSGYITTSFHTKFSRLGWKEAIFQAATVYIAPVLVNQFVIMSSPTEPELGSVIFGNSLRWGIPSTALVALGGFLADRLRRRKLNNNKPPCAEARPVRVEITVPWFASSVAQILAGGIVPAVALFPEMDKIYASAWGFKLCGAFSVLLSSFLMLVTLTFLLAVGFTRHDDHLWWWKSVFRGGSPAFSVFVYGVYFLSKMKVDRGTQIQVLGYNFCACYGLFLVLGTISFYVSSLVHRNYHLHKDE